MPRQVARSPFTTVSALAADQSAVLSRAQLARLGWNHDHVESAVSARRWTAYGSRAVVLHCGPLTTRQRWWIAVLNGGREAALAGPTAAEFWGLTGFESETVHIVVPRGAWTSRQQPGVKVHVSRRFGPSDLHPARALPTVRIERAAIDAAVWSRSGRRAAVVLIAVVQQNLTRPDLLREELEKAGQVRHRRLLHQVLDDVEGGVRALSELDFVLICHRYGLPRPALQTRRRGADGRFRYLDVRFRRTDGRILNVEVDGAAHFGVLAAWSDMDRDLSLLAKGEPTARVPAAVVRCDPAGVAERVRALLNAPW